MRLFALRDLLHKLSLFLSGKFLFCGFVCQRVKVRFISKKGRWCNTKLIVGCYFSLKPDLQTEFPFGGEKWNPAAQ